MTLLQSVLGFLILMGILVAIHEFGHFYVARKLGFKVLKFSIGFGKNLWSRKGKDGVEYAIGMIPLGGYVAFLDDSIEPVPEDQKQETFNAKPLWKRACVVAAGPLFNIALAIVLYWGLFMYGVPTYKAVIGTPLENSPMAQAGLKKGDEIISIDGAEVDSIESMFYGFIEYLDDGKATVDYKRGNNVFSTTIDIGEPLKLDAKSQIDKIVGVQAYFPDVKPEIGLVVSGGASESSGIKVGDVVTTINGISISTWDDLLNVVSKISSSAPIPIEIKRGTGALTVVMVSPQKGADNTYKLGLGVAFDKDQLMREFKSIQIEKKLGVVDALNEAFKKTYSDTVMIFKFLERLVTGYFHINTMAGPISIANIAGQALSSGVVSFVQLIALFSINIGLLNLLPIPVLDGGRLVGFGIEKIMGKHQFSNSIKIAVLKLGAIFVFGFMIVVLTYDVLRWF